MERTKQGKPGIPLDPSVHRAQEITLAKPGCVLIVWEKIGGKLRPRVVIPDGAGFASRRREKTA